MPRFLHTQNIGEWKKTVSGKTAVLRAVSILFMVLNGSVSNGQPVSYYEILHDYNNWTERSSNVILVNDSIYWTTAGYDFAQGNGTHLSLLKIYQDGEVVQEVNNESTEGRYEAGYLTNYGDSGILCLTSFNGLLNSTDRFAHRMTAFDTSGSVIWDHIYPDSGFTNTPDQLFETQTGYLITGQRYDNDDGDMVLMKTTESGDFLWRKTYGGSFYDSGGGVVNTPDGGYLLLGWTRSFGAGQRDFYLVKTDADGNEEWFETYGTGSMETGLDIIELLDGNFILAGAQITGGFDKGKLIKVDGSGSIIWQNEYLHPEATAGEINKVIELNDGTLACAGVADNSMEGNSGWLVKVNAQGEEIWQRKYNKNEYTDLFYNVLATDDGGFLLSGQARDAVTLSQDAWLLKVDSVGCTYPNCTVGIDEQGNKEILVDVWPNPVSDVLNIELTDFSASLEMSVFDVNGKEILRFAQKDKRSSIDVSSWPSGIYILKGTDDKGRSFSLKVVKQ